MSARAQGYARASQHLKSILWEIFQNQESQGLVTLHYPTMLLFLCIDQQTIRGAQKAFAMLANEDGLLSPQMVYEAFHVNTATHVEGDDRDPFSRDTIDGVFEEVAYPAAEGGAPQVDKITFQQMCSTHLGRVMLNNAQMFLKKQINFC